MANNLERFRDRIGGKSQVVEGLPAGSMPLPAILVSQDWFRKESKKIKSHGGRPTNAEWTIKRSVPFSDPVWGDLQVLSAEASRQGASVSPAQAASILVEHALKGGGASVVLQSSAAGETQLDAALDRSLLDRLEARSVPDLFLAAS